MNRNLLIVGAGVYGIVASEIASDMGCFEKIAFVDDSRSATPTGIKTVGTTDDLDKLAVQYRNIIVAMGNPEVRLSALHKIRTETPYRIVSLVSPKACISPSARISYGCIIEPMAVVHTGCVLAEGCIISAGAVVNHVSMCSAGVHVDCNAVVAGYTLVPTGKKIASGEVYKNECIRSKDLFFGVSDRKQSGELT